MYILKTKNGANFGPFHFSVTISYKAYLVKEHDDGKEVKCTKHSANKEFVKKSIFQKHLVQVYEQKGISIEI